MMIRLYNQQHPEYDYLRIRKGENAETWELIPGGGFKGEEVGLDYQTEEKILMGASDLRRFAVELRTLVKQRSQAKKELQLTFLSNVPQLKIIGQQGKMEGEGNAIGVILSRISDGDSRNTVSKPNEFTLAIGFNLVHGVRRKCRPEDQYLYENGGMHRFAYVSCSEEDVERFATELEGEVEYLRMQKDLDEHAKKKKKQTQ